MGCTQTRVAILECAGNSRVFLVPQAREAQSELGAANWFLSWKLKRWGFWSGVLLLVVCFPVSSAEQIRSRKTRAALRV